MKKYLSFPVYSDRKLILDALEANPVVVVESPTGSGKTIGIPIILRENGYLGMRKIAVTQPRRIAALNVCSFIRDQLDITDDEVACKIRFFDESTSDTKIKIMTDGILLEEIKKDPLLEAYSIVMVDEAHERSLNIDFILGLLKEILRKRSDLKVIISSATINTKLFSDYFDGAPVVSIEGKSFPVEVIHAPLDKDLTVSERDEQLIDAIVGICDASIDRDAGDILVFLPGERLIKKTCFRLNRVLREKDIIIYPLYSHLSKEDQLKVFTPTRKGQTKIVVSTNIAETSITIDGIKVVIDSGLVKINYYNQNNFSQSLVERKITKSNALQRQGRAGRVSEGVCYRIYSEEDFNEMQLYPEPEIKNSDLSEVVLRMLDIGIKDIEDFPFISNVGKENISSALRTLKFLDAIEGDRELTSIGRFMSSFPLPVRPARILAESVFRYPGALANIITILAFLSTKSPFLRSDDDPALARRRHRRFESDLGDYISLLQLYDHYTSFNGDVQAQDKWCEDMYLDRATMFEIASIRKQLEEMLAEKSIPLTDDCSEKEYLLCIMAGLKQFICKRIGPKEFASPFLSHVFISSSSLYKPRGEMASYIIASEIVRTNQLYAHLVSPILGNWVKPLGLSFPGAESQVSHHGRHSRGGDAHKPSGGSSGKSSKRKRSGRRGSHHRR